MVILPSDMFRKVERPQDNGERMFAENVGKNLEGMWERSGGNFRKLMATPIRRFNQSGGGGRTTRINENPSQFRRLQSRAEAAAPGRVDGAFVRPAVLIVRSGSRDHLLNQLNESSGFGHQFDQKPIGNIKVINNAPVPSRFSD